MKIPGDSRGVRYALICFVGFEFMSWNEFISLWACQYEATDGGSLWRDSHCLYLPLCTMAWIHRANGKMLQKSLERSY